MAKPKKVTPPGKVRDAVVDEVPRSVGHSSAAYARTMAAIRADVGAGKPVAVASFINRRGAYTVKLRLTRGDYPVDGRLSDWEFDAVETGDGGSTLYVTLKSKPRAKK